MFHLLIVDITYKCWNCSLYKGITTHSRIPVVHSYFQVVFIFTLSGNIVPNLSTFKLLIVRISYLKIKKEPLASFVDLLNDAYLISVFHQLLVAQKPSLLSSLKDMSLFQFNSIETLLCSGTSLNHTQLTQEQLRLRKPAVCRARED